MRVVAQLVEQPFKNTFVKKYCSSYKLMEQSVAGSSPARPPNQPNNLVSNYEDMHFLHQKW